MDHGPVDVLFLTFPADLSIGELAQVLRPPVESGAIRLIDCVLMVRDADGNVGVRDLEEEDGLPPELLDLGIDANDLLSDLDIALFVDSLDDGELGVVVVYEELWARETVARIRELGAEVGLFLRVPPEDVEAAFAAAAES